MVIQLVEYRRYLSGNESFYSANGIKIMFNFKVVINNNIVLFKCILPNQWNMSSYEIINNSK